MAHPLKSDATSAHNAKLRSMTTHYGSASGPANNITTPGERLKGEEGEKGQPEDRTDQFHIVSGFRKNAGNPG